MHKVIEAFGSLIVRGSDYKLQHFESIVFSGSFEECLTFSQQQYETD